MRLRIGFALLSLLAGLLLPHERLAAQAARPASSVKGIFAGVHLNGSSILPDEQGAQTENGSGLALQLGYGFTGRFALLLDATGATIDSRDGDYTLAHADLLARYSWTDADQRWVPFIEGGVSARQIRQDNVPNGDGTSSDLSLMGSGVTFGAGLQYYTSPSWALGAGLKWTTGTFTDAKVDNITVSGLDLKATSARFNLGVTWYPQTGK